MSLLNRRPIRDSIKRREVKEIGEMSQFDFLPAKLRDQLMPFQRDGILFGIKKNGK